MSLNQYEREQAGDTPLVEMSDRGSYQTFAVPGPWASVNEFEAANEAAGRFFFSPGAKRFFRSRIGREMFYGRFFITSEQFDEDSPRRYTIRVALDGGDTTNLSEFQQYEGRGQAVRAIHAAVRATRAGQS